MLYLLLAGIPSVLLHEAGHALAARRRLAVSSDIRVRVTPIGVGGSTAFDSTGATRADVVLIALAGPAASAVGALLAVLAYGHTTGRLHALVWWLVLEGVLGTVLNLIPMTLVEHPDRPPLRTDGWHVLDALRSAPAPPPVRSPVAPSAARRPGARPLRGRDGIALGVEPLPRGSAQPEPEDDGLDRRARALARNHWRSVPPPGS